MITTFEPTPDGWVHVAPKGTFPHPNGSMQVLDGEACEAMLRAFNEEAKQPNFPGLLVDFDHFSHDPAQASTAAGWIGALEHREDGLHAKIRWSDLGHAALTGGRYRLSSPVWNRADCDQWSAPVPPEGKEVVHLRPRRLDRLALTNDPNLPGLAPLSNRAGVSVEPLKRTGVTVKPPPLPVAVPDLPASLRTEVLRYLQLGPSSSEKEMSEALRNRAAEVESLRDRCAHLREAQAEHDLERFADVIVNREVVRGQLLANRGSTLALLEALRPSGVVAPLHQPRVHRPNLQLLSPVAMEPDPASARRVANRARQLQSQLRIGHHAAFRMAEGEAADSAA